MTLRVTICMFFGLAALLLLFVVGQTPAAFAKLGGDDGAASCS